MKSSKVFLAASAILALQPAFADDFPKLDLGKYRDAKGTLILDKARAKAGVHKKRAVDSLVWGTYGMSDQSVPGTNTEKAYRELRLSTEPGTQIIVAVIDSGFDLNHEDLQGQWAMNEAEVNGVDGVDDDHNGYIDDKLGWNFLGSVTANTLEITREAVRLQGTPEGTALMAEVTRLRESAQATLDRFMVPLQMFNTGITQMRADGYTGGETRAEVEAYQPRDTQGTQGKAAALNVLTWLESTRLGTVAVLREYVAELNIPITIQYNPAMVGHVLIEGDEPNNPDQRVYGDNNVMARDDQHGTHVSGIIAAIRGNGIGMDGQASNNVKILPIRVVPNGDERDKDVANGMRYAVDMGARVINMSFGKQYNSPFYPKVQEAIRYAEEHGVLMIHSAGNDNADLDKVRFYPDPSARVNGDHVGNWVSVGASTEFPNEDLVAYFSNFGQSFVDIFAPGYRILSTVPGNHYEEFNGTSMAGPEVAGVAALVLSQRTDLTYIELREALMESANRQFSGMEVKLPRDDETMVDPPKGAFSTLSNTGAIVDAYRALRQVGVPIR